MFLETDFDGQLRNPVDHFRFNTHELMFIETPDSFLEIFHLVRMQFVLPYFKYCKFFSLDFINCLVVLRHVP